MPLVIAFFHYDAITIAAASAVFHADALLSCRHDELIFAISPIFRLSSAYCRLSLG